MIEGKKISELNVVTSLQNGCCFPVLSRGATRRITFASLLTEIQNGSGISELQEEMGELQNEVQNLNEHVTTGESAISELTEHIADYDSQIENINNTVEGQNATIREYGDKVDAIETVIEETHFDDVMALETQVENNKQNITTLNNTVDTKLNNTTISENAGKVVKVDTNGDLIFGEVINSVPIGFVYTQYPFQLAPWELWTDLDATHWENISSLYDSMFMRIEGEKTVAFGEGSQGAELPNVRGKFGEFKSISLHVFEGAFNLYRTTGSSNDQGSGGPSAGSFSLSQGQTNTNGNYIGEEDSVYKDGGEVRPENITIRIWKRVN